MLYSMHTHVFTLNGTSAANLTQQCNCSTGQQLKDGAQTCTQAQYIEATQAPWAADFHVYGLEWSRTRLAFYLDNALVWALPNCCLHQPLILRFDRETMPDWFGLPDPNNLPDRPMQVDYVHAWQAA
jgi:hypothetical protein